MTKYLFVDSHAMLYRGHYAMMRNPLKAEDGTNTSGLFYLIKKILELRESRNPDVIAAVFDYPAPTFRAEIYPEYKANRPSMPDELRIQSNCARKLIPALGIPLLQREGLEADDIIAWMTQEASANGDEVEILTSDKDLLQLVNDNVTVIRPGSGNRHDTIVKMNDVVTIMGVRADQIVDYLSLMGDSSDNIPGAKGIGSKTALKLLDEYDNLDSIYRSINDISPDSLRLKLEKSRQMVALSRELISLIPARTMNILPEELYMKTPDAELAGPLLRSLGMKSIIDRTGILPPEDLFGGWNGDSSDSWCASTIIRNLDDLTDYLPNDDVIALDTETTSKRPFQALPVGLSITSSDKGAAYIPLCGPDALDPDEVVRTLDSILMNRPIVAQNGKYDIHILESMGLHISGLSGDPMIADYLLRPEVRSHSLSALSTKWLGRSMISFTDVLGNSSSLADVDTSKVADYCCCDSATALNLSSILREELQKDAELLNIYDTLELPLVKVISDMERRGIGLDIESLAKLESEFSDIIIELEQYAATVAGCKINLNSPSQVSGILFDKLGLSPAGKTGKGANSSSMEVLEKLKGKHEFVDTVIEHRQLSKLLNTYIKKLPGYVCDKDNMIHTSFSQTVTATGRLSSSSPNLQNIPVRTSRGREVRRCFIPGRADHVLITADYSQIELRILAHMAGPGNLRKAFYKNIDIHSSTAEVLFGDASDEHRRKAKEVNFSILYGISSWGLSNRLNVSRGEASGIIKRYLDNYPELESFFQRCIEYAEEHGETRTILGRKREFEGFRTARGSTRNAMERMVINTTVQGTAADIIKIAMLEVDQKLRNEKLNAGLVLQVHDELVLTAAAEDADDIARIVRNEMESAFELEVPLAVDTGWGKNWLEAQH